MDKYEAVTYIVENGSHHSEWMGAGLYDLVCDVVNEPKMHYTKDELDTLIELAEDN